MTDDEREVLEHVRRFVQYRNIYVRPHGDERSRQKNVTFKDKRNAILTATRCLWQPDYRTYRLSGGKDLGDEPLDVIVVVRRNDVTGQLCDPSIQNVLVP